MCLCLIMPPRSMSLRLQAFLRRVGVAPEGVFPSIFTISRQPRWIDRIDTDLITALSPHPTRPKTLSFDGLREGMKVEVISESGLVALAAAPLTPTGARSATSSSPSMSPVRLVLGSTILSAALSAAALVQPKGAHERILSWSTVSSSCRRLAAPGVPYFLVPLSEEVTTLPSAPVEVTPSWCLLNFCQRVSNVVGPANVTLVCTDRSVWADAVRLGIHLNANESAAHAKPSAGLAVRRLSHRLR